MDSQIPQTTASARSQQAKQPRYVLLWERIQSMEKKLLNQEAIYNAILRQFATSIRPLEVSVTQSLMELTQSLMRCFDQDDDIANRSLLGFWIIENFSVLNTHPFADNYAVESLYDEWRLPLQGTEDMIESQLSLLMAGRSDLPGQTQHRRNYPDADMFAARKPTPQPSWDPADIPSFDDVFESGQSPQEDLGSTANPEGESFNNTQAGKTKKKAASKGTAGVKNFAELFNIDTLFRKIARTVHPDREQDEEKKAQKHEIMSACLQARNEDDIATLLTLYTTHVGPLPNTWSEDSTVDLVTALSQQLEELERRWDNLQVQDPLLQLILDRYLGFDTDDVERRILGHKTKLENEIQRLKRQQQTVKTDDGLADLLAERRDIEMDKLVLADLTS